MWIVIITGKGHNTDAPQYVGPFASENDARSYAALEMPSTLWAYSWVELVKP